MQIACFCLRLKPRGRRIKWTRHDIQHPERRSRSWTDIELQRSNVKNCCSYKTPLPRIESVSCMFSFNAC
ncbi:hypothetical protein PUN28_012568 [Cardiocondyla obscurior]|uniref:Uncharacterized protein n=1 Tax=Cardiocondyla obscurior TaxID=286306 RepID=A0AAW2FFF7_9HYME